MRRVMAVLAEVQKTAIVALLDDITDMNKLHMIIEIDIA